MGEGTDGFPPGGVLGGVWRAAAPTRMPTSPAADRIQARFREKRVGLGMVWLLKILQAYMAQVYWFRRRLPGQFEVLYIYFTWMEAHLVRSMNAMLYVENK